MDSLAGTPLAHTRLPFKMAIKSNHHYFLNIIFCHRYIFFWYSNVLERLLTVMFKYNVFMCLLLIGIWLTCKVHLAIRGMGGKERRREKLISFPFFSLTLAWHGRAPQLRYETWRMRVVGHRWGWLRSTVLWKLGEWNGLEARKKESGTKRKNAKFFWSVFLRSFTVLYCFSPLWCCN